MAGSSDQKVSANTGRVTNQLVRARLWLNYQHVVKQLKKVLDLKNKQNSAEVEQSRGRKLEWIPSGGKEVEGKGLQPSL